MKLPPDQDLARRQARDAELLEQWRRVMELEREIREIQKDNLGKRRAELAVSRERLEEDELERAFAAGELRPELEPIEMANPSVYIVDEDLGGVRDVVDRNYGEFRQWRMRDELSPTACAILAIHSIFRGLRGGRDGCGMQVSNACWVRVLGRSERQVNYAFAELRERGLVVRRARYVDRPDGWADGTRDRTGRLHLWKRAEVYSASYLTPLGARRIERRGETRRLTVTAGGHGLRRVLVAVGVVGNLLKQLAQRIRVIALRVTDAEKNCDPSSELNQRRTTYRSGDPELVENRGLEPPAMASAHTDARRRGISDGGSFHDRAATAFNAEVERLWSKRLMTAATAYPDLWARADAERRRRLDEEFAPFRRVLTWRLQKEVRNARLESDGRGPIRDRVT